MPIIELSRVLGVKTWQTAGSHVPVEHRYRIDRILEDKIRDLRNDTRYKEILLQNYFRRLHVGHGATILLTDRTRYRYVEDCISQLWVHSSKNPSVFATSLDFEPILQRIPYYRDHFIHSFNVFVMGYYILNRLEELYPEIDLKSNDYNLTWMLASTFHDVAYPLQEMESWLNELFEKFLGVDPKFHLDITQVMPMIYVDFMRIITRCHTGHPQAPLGGQDIIELDWAFYNLIGARLIEKEHGVLGGLMLFHLLAVREGFTRERAWDFLFNHLPACHAITVHHLPVKIKFERHPLAYLLIMLDEIQDWGRPASKQRKDKVRVIDIDVVPNEKCSKPVIHFVLKGSERRKRELYKNLSERLDQDSISVVFSEKQRV